MSTTKKLGPPLNLAATKISPTKSAATTATIQTRDEIKGRSVLDLTKTIDYSIGTESKQMKCQCGSNVETRIEKKPGPTATTIALVICAIGGWCGCQLVPLICCKDTNHYCPNCDALLGKEMFMF